MNCRKMSIQICIFNEVVEDSTGALLGDQQTETPNEGFDCEYCPATFTFEDQLEDHIEIEHDVINSHKSMLAAFFIW